MYSAMNLSVVSERSRLMRSVSEAMVIGETEKGSEEDYMEWCLMIDGVECRDVKREGNE